MLENYFPILVFIFVALIFACVPIIIGRLVGPHRPDPDKLSPYECGSSAFEDARIKFDVRYYLIAIAFIIFDLEVAYMFPWAAIYQEFVAVENPAVRSFGFIEMFIFLGILVVGFIWAWLKGALDWE